MRTEADEVADTMRTAWFIYCQHHGFMQTEANAQAFVRTQMKGESETVIENVAHSLLYR
jgi:hypothetical protein